jgi:hypothetical protein
MLEKKPALLAVMAKARGEDLILGKRSDFTTTRLLDVKYLNDPILLVE